MYGPADHRRHLPRRVRLTGKITRLGIQALKWCSGHNPEGNGCGTNFRVAAKGLRPISAKWQESPALRQSAALIESC